MRIIDADELMEHVWRDKLDSRELIAKMIENAPTVKEIPTKIPLEVFEQLISQEPKTAHWIFDDECKEHGHCSRCEYGIVDLADGEPHNFCPNCGARMVEKADVKDETDNLVEIGTLEPGTTIEVSGIQMEIFNKPLTMKNGNELSVAAFCLAKDILFEKAFDEEDCNNWEKSSLRKYLNGKYKDNLPDELREALIPFDRNLLTDDGMKDYRTCVDLISLISEREYQDHREYISDKSDWWWTLTACSAISGYSSEVRLVTADGSFDYNHAYLGSYGVSPVFLLRPSLKVKIVEEKKKEG